MTLGSSFPQEFIVSLCVKGTRMGVLVLLWILMYPGLSLGTWIPDASLIPGDALNAWKQFHPAAETYQFTDGVQSPNQLTSKNPSPRQNALGEQAARSFFRTREFQYEVSAEPPRIMPKQVEYINKFSGDVGREGSFTFLRDVEQPKQFANEQQRMNLLRSQGVPKKIYDPKHGVKMGIPIHECDDGRVNITRDWDGNPFDYTCTTGLKNLPLVENPINEEHDYPTPNHMSGHWCMFNKIVYDEPIPTFGDHRPIWPKFGEYTYLPRERYLHNLEHGAVALFYHPCAKPWLVDQVRVILVNCMRRYIISANKNVPLDKPLLLVAWGSKLFMSSVSENEVVSFIRRKAMRGPESRTSTQGYYRFGLIRESLFPVRGSDINETNICPQYDPDI